MVDVGMNGLHSPEAVPSVPCEFTGEYLASLVHDLRNPLSPIRSATELLRTLCSDPRQLQAIDLISRQVVDLTHRLDDFADAAAQQPLLESANPGTGDATRALKIVVIDDHEDSARMWMEYFAHSGHSVLTAGNGELGVQLAAQVQPDAIIIDIGLPGIDGFDVGRALRKNPRTSHALLIAVSGYSLKQFRDIDAYSVFRHYLLKPISAEGLLYIIEKSLEDAGRR